MSDNQEIKFTVSAEGAEVTAAKLNSVGKAAGTTAGDVADASNKSSLGFRSMALAAHGLGDEFGLTGRMGRLFGHEVADLTFQLGKFCLGLVSIRRYTNQVGLIIEFVLLILFFRKITGIDKFVIKF